MSYVIRYAPAKERPGYYRSCRNGVVRVTEFNDAMLFADRDEADSAAHLWAESLLSLHAEVWPQPEVVPLYTIPQHAHFLHAIPIDGQHLPEPGQEVALIWRDGHRCGVFSDFLRKEILSGRLFDSPDFIRYINQP